VDPKVSCIVTVRQFCLEKACAADVSLQYDVDFGSLCVIFSRSSLEERDRIKQKSKKNKKISGVVERCVDSNLGYLLRSASRMKSSLH